MSWRRILSKPSFHFKPNGTPYYWKSSIAASMAIMTGSVVLMQQEHHEKPKWLIEFEQNTDFENISDTVPYDSSSFMNDSHFIHAKTNIKDRYEQFDVYRVKGQAVTYGIVRFGTKLCGHAGLVHGGCIATIIDELCGWTFGIVHNDGRGFTANLNVNYRIPIPANTTVLIRSEVIKVERRKVYVKCSLEDGNGKVFSDGVALFVRPKDNSI